jgi:hypothetical protein
MQVLNYEKLFWTKIHSLCDNQATYKKVQIFRLFISNNFHFYGYSIYKG